VVMSDKIRGKRVDRYALDEYERIVRDECRTVIDTCADSWETYYRVRDNICASQETHQLMVREAWRECVRIRTDAWKNYNTMEDLVFYNLLVSVSDDPVAEWLVLRQLRQNPGKTLQVLRMLPCTLSRVETLARREQWCHMAERVMQASREGILD